MNPETRTSGELARPATEPVDVAPAARVSRVVAVPRAGQVGPPPAPAAAITPLGLLRALRRRSALALGVALIAAGLAGPAAWFLVPVSFRAQAQLHVAAQPPKVLFATVETQNAGTGDDYKRYQSTQLTLLKSGLVLSAALRDLKVTKYRMIEQVNPVAWLREKLKVEFVDGSEVMEISLSGGDAEEVAGIVNAVTKAYIDEVVNVDLKRRVTRLDQLKKIKDAYDETLTQRRAVMRKLAESVGSNDPETLALRQQYAEEHLQHLRKELLDVQSQKRKFEAQLGLAQPGEAGEPAAGPTPPSEQEIDRLVERHPAVSELADALVRRQQQLNAERANMGRISRNPAAEPSVRALRNAVEGLQRLLDELRKEVRPEVIRQAQGEGPVVAGVPSGGPDLRRDLAFVKDLERLLEADIKAISVDNHSMTVKTLDLQSNQEEIAQTQVVLEKVATEVEALKVEIEAPPRIRSIAAAAPPSTRDDKKRYMMVGMVTFGSFFVGLFGIAFLELQTRKVDSADEVPAELGLTVVGALPMLPARSRRRGAIAGRETDKDRYWRNLLLESVDATRTLLLHAARTGSYRVMMITSAVGGEGKTSLASYLATSLARSGLQVLLIDADLRSPMMHGLFDRPPAPGLSELLRDEAGLEEALGETAVEGLTLLAAGRCDRQALRNLSRGGLAPLLDRLKQRFDFILVDSSPILPVADAMLIAQQADAAIFSIFRDVSRKTKVKAAAERLQCLGVPVLGTVVTGAHGGQYGNSYYEYGSGPTYPALPESVAVSSDSVSGS